MKPTSVVCVVSDGDDEKSGSEAQDA
jgi:hypothetical protein